MSDLGEFGREDVRQVLSKFGISRARLAETVGDDEEIILVAERDYAVVDIDRLTRELMVVLPHKKVWVTPDNHLWPGEGLL